MSIEIHVSTLLYKIEGDVKTPWKKTDVKITIFKYDVIKIKMLKNTYQILYLILLTYILFTNIYK